MSEHTADQPRPDDSRTGDDTTSVAAETTAADSADAKLVPVGESIKYRRRAQQAEGRCRELERKLQDLESQLTRGRDEVAAAEARRDEAAAHATRLENRLGVERKLAEAGAVDIEAASLLLSRRADLDEPLEDEQLDRHVEQLLLDKPFLTASADLPAQTASARPSEHATAGDLARAARRAVSSGDRRDIAEYLRLRRTAEAND